jgi:hypothetical protein
VAVSQNKAYRLYYSTAVRVEREREHAVRHFLRENFLVSHGAMRKQPLDHIVTEGVLHEGYGIVDDFVKDHLLLVGVG